MYIGHFFLGLDIKASNHSFDTMIAFLLSFSKTLNAFAFSIGPMSGMSSPLPCRKTPIHASLCWDRHVLGDEVLCVCTSSCFEAPHNDLFLLDNVNLCPSAAKLLSDRAVSLLRLNSFHHLHFNRGSVLNALLLGFLLTLAGHLKVCGMDV